jgi:myo-inositol-1(or 4)-monophosphatase
VAIVQAGRPFPNRDALAALLEVATAAALDGGREVARSFRVLDTVEVRDKAAGDYVTDADLASEAAIRAVLARETPHWPVLGEEGGGPRSWEPDSAATWVVDPLDGTTNFVRGLAMVGVSVGLVVGGTPVVGVVHAPLMGLTFTAALGLGAFLSTDVRPERGRRRLGVSQRTVSQALCGHGFLPRAQRLADDDPPGMLDRVLAEVEDLRRIGSASLDLAWTAAGSLDGFFHRALGPWDVAAGALLVREAGGVVTDHAGDDRAWLASGDILAGSPRCHALLLSAAVSSAASPPRR